MQEVPFAVWLLFLSTMLLTFIYVLHLSWVYAFKKCFLGNILLYEMPQSIYPFDHWGTFRWFLVWGYYKIKPRVVIKILGLDPRDNWSTPFFPRELIPALGQLPGREALCWAMKVSLPSACPPSPLYSCPSSQGHWGQLFRTLTTHMSLMHKLFPHGSPTGMLKSSCDPPQNRERTWTWPCFAFYKWTCLSDLVGKPISLFSR